MNESRHEKKRGKNRKWKKELHKEVQQIDNSRVSAFLVPCK